MGFPNLLPKEEQYFDLFNQMTVYISDAARELQDMLSDKDPDFAGICATDQGIWSMPVMNSPTALPLV